MLVIEPHSPSATRCLIRSSPPARKRAYSRTSSESCGRASPREFGKPNAGGSLVPRYWRVLSLVLPAAVAAQQPGSAGATRPKLEVLQSLPEAQLFPLMNLVATSLGVHCDYCHVQATPD